MREKTEKKSDRKKKTKKIKKINLKSINNFYIPLQTHFTDFNSSL